MYTLKVGLKGFGALMHADISPRESEGDRPASFITTALQTTGGCPGVGVNERQVQDTCLSFLVANIGEAMYGPVWFGGAMAEREAGRLP